MSKLFDLLSRIISNVNALEQTNTDLSEEVDALRQDIAGIDIGGRNMLVDSDTPKSSANYVTGSYFLGKSIPVVGQTYTLRLKGELGEGKEYFWAFNTTSSIYLATLTDNGDGTHSATFQWTNSKGTTTVDPTHISIFAYPREVEVTSSIEWIKLEEGSKATSWTPAPEDEKAPELLVTVEVDSLNTANLTSDKTFSEIEEAVLDGMNVRVKLICSGVNHHIYLQMTAHQQGSEIAFCGYFNNLPLVLRITAD
jgi:hypothetical protein